METYYTSLNFSLYFLAVLLLLLLVPLAVVIGVGKRSTFLNNGIVCIIGAVFIFPLSRTCPYKEISQFLYGGSFFFLFLGSAIILSWIIYSVIRGKRNIRTLTLWEIDRWIARMLKGSYLIMDRRGNLLGGDLSGLSQLVQPDGSTFRTYLDKLLSCSEEPWQREILRESCERGLFGEGTLKLNNRCFQWFHTPLGERKILGYLFSMLDITEENRLLEQRQQQEKILNLRLKRIREQGLIKVHEERTKIKAAAIQQSTEMIKNRLEELFIFVNGLETCHGPDRERGLLQAVSLGERTMESIRKTVHAMAYPSGRIEEKGL